MKYCNQKNLKIERTQTIIRFVFLKIKTDVSKREEYENVKRSWFKSIKWSKKKEENWLAPKTHLKCLFISYSKNSGQKRGKGQFRKQIKYSSICLQKSWFYFTKYVLN